MALASNGSGLAGRHLSPRAVGFLSGYEQREAPSGRKEWSLGMELNHAFTVFNIRVIVTTVTKL